MRVMSTRVFTSLLAILSGACGSDAEPVTATEAREVFTVSNELVHSLHLDALDLPAWPATYERACPDGGTLSMTSEVDAQGRPTQLFHTFSGCGSKGWTFGGTLDYQDIVFCETASASYSIVGDLELAGHGGCSIEASEMCGQLVSGQSCGVTL